MGLSWQQGPLSPGANRSLAEQDGKIPARRLQALESNNLPGGFSPVDPGKMDGVIGHQVQQRDTLSEPNVTADCHGHRAAGGESARRISN